MDHDDELAKFKQILIAGVTFLIAAYFSYQELKYFVWGTTAEATISRTFDTRERKRDLIAVEYRFADEEGKQYSERDDVPIDWPLPEEKITVQYIPGVEDSSRIEGHSNTFAVWVFLGSCAWLTFSFYKIYKEASEAVHGNRRRR